MNCKLSISLEYLLKNTSVVKFRVYSNSTCLISHKSAVKKIKNSDYIFTSECALNEFFYNHKTHSSQTDV